MGVLSKAVRAVVPAGARSVASTIPTWQDGVPQLPPTSYDRFAREGYQRNEVVFACIDQLCTSVAEPRLAAYVKGGRGGKATKLDAHPILDLLERPNPFMSRNLFWQSAMLYRALAGNVFIEKARSRRGVAELWLWRPDRVRVVPDAQTFIRGYELTVGADQFTLPAADIIHSKNRAALDDFYGMPPIQAAAARVDTDNYMREFVRAFFTNAGVPSGLLNIKNKMGPQEKELLQARYRQGYAGPSGWWNLLVMDGTEADYTPMGLPLGERGLAMSDLDDITSSRIAAAFGVPLSIVGTKLGMASSSYANRASDLRLFWQLTLIPIYREFAAALNSGLVPEYEGVDYVEFDLSDVKALEEDRNEFHERVRADFEAGLLGRTQAQKLLGYPEPDADDTYFVPVSLTPEPVTPEPEPEPQVAPALSLVAGKPGRDTALPGGGVPGRVAPPIPSRGNDEKPPKAASS